jgi:hypothetical protein
MVYQNAGLEANSRGGVKTVHVVFIFPEACCRKGGGGRSNPFPPHHHPIFQLIGDTSFEDDVTVILLLGISFTFGTVYRGLVLISIALRLEKTEN